MKYKYRVAISEGDKIPRKIKKNILGKKLNKNKLRKLLSTVIFGQPIKTMYETRQIHPFYFCPKCGCQSTRKTGNMTVYPEHYENWYCLRCNHLVAQIDNSPLYHCLEFPECNYEIQ